ncbi:MAG: hypothetical protein HYY62_08285 [Deltaproteobacteria bacterium]|nr:hypothetical protein [Deltaproteobacteria bacterium]
MKKIIFFVFMMGVSFSQAGWSGHAEGNGGDTDTQDSVREFLEVTDLVALDLNSWAKDDFPELSGEKLLEYKNTTRVYAKPVVQRELEEVDAKNYPATDQEPAWIEFSMVRWKIKNLLEKKALVFHEFCGVARLEENRGSVSDYNTSARYKNKLLERDRDTETFRATFRFYLRSIGEEALVILNPDTTVAIQEIEKLRKSDLYKTATNTREKKHWWQSVRVSKEEQTAATMELSEKLSVLAWMGDVQAKVVILKKRDQAFQDWIAAMGSMQRQEEASNTREEFLKTFRVISSEINQIHSENLDRMYQKCYLLPLAKSVDCAFEFILYQLNHTFPQAVQGRKTTLETTLQAGIDKINQYYE